MAAQAGRTAAIKFAGERELWAVLVAWSMWALQREPNWS